MPTRPDRHVTPSAAARAEAERWLSVADQVATLGDIEPRAFEAEVVGFYDPGDDLDRRAAGWNHELSDHGLQALALFAAGLAAAEATAWDESQPDVAARAFADRRHLVGDRLVHWAVPWLFSVAQSDTASAGEAAWAVRALLQIGDRLRPAPFGAGAEGLHPPGEDTFGPLDPGVGLEQLVTSVWAGAVLLRSTWSAAPDSEGVPDLHRGGGVLARFADAAVFWAGLAESHPGTAALWMDLAARATSTMAAIEAYRKA